MFPNFMFFTITPFCHDYLNYDFIDTYLYKQSLFSRSIEGTEYNHKLSQNKNVR